jgi:hypothetical protein
MYLESAWALGIVIGVSVLADVVVAPVLGETKIVDQVTNITLFATGAFLGNGLYLRRVRREVSQARRTEPDPVKRNELLARRGGRAWLWPIVATFVSVGLVLLAATMEGTP